MTAAGRDFATMQDFIVGRLSDNERQAFEDRLAREPALARELEQSLRLREGLQGLRTQGYLARPASRNNRFRIWIPALVAAACAGIALFLPLSNVKRPSPILMASPESRAADATALVAAHFTFVSVRGDSTPDLDLPSAGLIEIRAAPSTRENSWRYHVTLIRQQEGGAAQPVAALADLALSADGYVHCYAEAGRLTKGSYVLRIQSDSDTPGTQDLFPFNLRADVTGSSR